MKPIKAKELLQKFEQWCSNDHEVYNFIAGAAVMTELFQQQGIITKGQDNYLQIQFTQMSHRIMAKKNKERKQREEAIQEKRQEEEKAIQEKRKQESTCPICGKQALIERWYPRCECDPLMGGCGHVKPGLEEMFKAITERQKEDRALLERVKEINAAEEALEVKAQVKEAI